MKSQAEILRAEHAAARVDAITDAIRREQRARIKAMLLSLHRRGYTIRIGRSGPAWFCYVGNGEDVDLLVTRPDRVDAIANAISGVELAS